MTIPKPFKRPQVQIGDSVDRRWKRVCVYNLSLGDIVANNGRLDASSIKEDSICLSFMDGHDLIVDPSHVVFAFTQGASVGYGE